MLEYSGLGALDWQALNNEFQAIATASSLIREVWLMDKILHDAMSTAHTGLCSATVCVVPALVGGCLRRREWLLESSWDLRTTEPLTLTITVVTYTRPVSESACRVLCPVISSC